MLHEGSRESASYPRGRRLQDWIFDFTSDLILLLDCAGLKFGQWMTVFLV